MFSNNKSLVISTLLTGTAVATGTLMYGVFSNEPDELIILDDTLPPVLGNGLLPPPATYVMKTPPPADIPGIRRLKIARPSLETRAAAPASQQAASGADDATQAVSSNEDFYLTGTRSAELIRAPVEARIETFPTIALDEAVEGALAVDEWGFQVVQSYLAQAMGDANALKARMDALLARIEAEAGNYDLATISDAANLIIEAGARTHWTAFMAPFILDPSFKLPDDAIGWDFGPQEEKPYNKFTRVSADSKMVVGDNAQNENAFNGPSILGNGIQNIEQFVATGLKNGRYRVVILTAPRRNGRSPLYPFGVDVKRNEAKINIVDTRSTDGLVPVMKLSTEGVGRLSDAPLSTPSAIDDNATTSLFDADFTLTASASGTLASNSVAATTLQFGGNGNFDIAPSETLQPFAQAGDFIPFEQAGGTGGAPTAGNMLVTRAEVTDGTLRLSFRQLGGQDTYVTAVILYPETDTISIEETLAEEVVEFLQKIAPAAGQNLTAENILQAEVPIVDAVTIFSDASGGLPTQEAVNATPVAENTAGSAPEPESAPATVTASTPTPSPESTPTPEENPVFEGTDPEPTPTPDPGPTDPGPTDPGPTDPGPTDPGPTDPGPTDPGPTDPGPTDPGPTDPGPTDPGPTDPGPTDPGPTDPDPGPDTGGGPGGGGGIPQTKELILDAGGGDDEIYDPVILGNAIELNGCGSTFENEVVCSLADTSDFEIVWLLGDTELGTGTELTIQTGEGTLFENIQDNIQFTAAVRYDGVLLTNGTILNIGAGDGSGGPFFPGDIILTSLDTALISIIAAPVSEPGALFLLAPGLVYVVNRERRRRRKRKHVTV